jgi:hypothetical protein
MDLGVRYERKRNGSRELEIIHTVKIHISIAEMG